MSQSSDSSWEQRSTRVVHKTPWFELIEDHVTTPTGAPGVYTYVRAGEFVLIVPRDSAGRILLVLQWRYPLGQKLWELPAGYLDGGESPEAAAARELGEEGGVRADTWSILGDTYESTSTNHQCGIVLLAEDLTDAPELLRPDDGILERRWFSPEELKHMIQTNQIPDSKTRGALLQLLYFDDLS